MKSMRELNVFERPVDVLQSSRPCQAHLIRVKSAHVWISISHFSHMLSNYY